MVGCSLRAGRCIQSLTLSLANLRRNLYRGGIAEETLAVSSFHVWLFKWRTADPDASDSDQG